MQKRYSTVSIQRLQMFNLLTLMFIGKILLNFPISWLHIAVVIGFSIVLEHAILWFKQGSLNFFSYSSVNTSLGVIFLLRAVDLYIFLIVIVIAIAQKHLLKIDGKHFLNPSNIAVIAGLSLFPYQTYTSPEQWGSFWGLGILMIFLGFYITHRVGRLMIPLVFMLAYTILSYLFLTHNIVEIFLILISGSFILFIFFMLTDPRTTPETTLSQVMFSVIIALLTIVLELFLGVKDINMFLALFIVTLSIPWVRHFELLPIAQKIYKILFVLIILIVVLLYFSTFNIIRNMQNIEPIKSIPLTEQNISIAKDFENETLLNWHDDNNTLYKKVWKTSHTVAIKYKKNKTSEITFPDGSNIFSKYIPHLQRQHMGWNFMHHSALASGDINHDGYIDLIIAKPTNEIQVWINTKDSNFTNVTKQIFENSIPKYVDVVALADMNNDSWLDLIVLNNSYANPKANHALYLYHTKSKKFKYSRDFNASIGVTGGLATHDINHDDILDLYIVNSRNWNTSKRRKGFMRSHGLADQFWVSDINGTWQENIEKYLPLAKEGFAGMTVQFTDINNDGKSDFLIGNDMQPSFTMLGKESGFELIKKEKIPYNSDSSMSYYSVDFDNDGILELWENSISTSTLYQKNRFKDTISQSKKYFDKVSTQLEEIRSGVHSGKIDCSKYDENYLGLICREKVALYRGSRLADVKACDSVENIGQRIFCKTLINTKQLKPYDPRNSKFESERFPQKVQYNIALRLDTEGKYVDALVDKDAQFTGWSWAGVSYDIDNDGMLDQFITTGAEISLQRVPNVLLINKTRPIGKVDENIKYKDSDKSTLLRGSSIRFANKSEFYGLGSLEDSRGAIIADFDLDGDGDIIVNPIFHAPMYNINALGGTSIQIELRSKNSNYFALGSRLELHTNKGIQTREIHLGGSWDSAPSVRQHFGLSWGEEIKELKIRWEDGHEQTIMALKKNHFYVIYE